MKQENKIEELEGDLSEANQEIGSLKHQLQKADKEIKRETYLKEEWKRQHEYLRKDIKKFKDLLIKENKLNKFDYDKRKELLEGI